MLEVYIDGLYIDPDNYQNLKQKWTMFDKVFKLGITMARQFTMTMPKSAFNIMMKSVKIKYNNVDYAYLDIDSYKFSEGGTTPTVELVMVDRMVKANFNYDASGIVPCTTKDILVDIASKMGVELGTTSFINDDIVVDYWDNTVQARTYLSYLAEDNGGFARIENDGKLYLRNFKDLIPKELNKDLCENIILGNPHKIERVVFDNGVLKYETSSDEALETVYLNPTNVYMLTQEQFNKTANSIMGFEYRNLDTGKTKILSDALVGDILTLNYEGTNYNTICQYSELNFLGTWNGGYKLNLESPTQAETQIKGNVDNIKDVKVSLNRIDNTLSIVVKNVGENTGQISELVISDEEIRQSVQSVVENLGENYYTLTQTNTLVNNATEGLMNTFSRAGGNNLFMNSSLFFGEVNNYDYWNGNLKQVEFIEAITKKAFGLQQGVVTQILENLSGGWFSLRFGVKKIGTGLDTHLQFEINDQTFDILEDGFIEFSFENNSGTTSMSFLTDASDQYIIYDLMLNYGQDVYLPYQQAMNEVRTSTVQISESVKVESNISNTVTTLGANGLEGYNKTTGALVFKQTDTGLYSLFIKTDSAEISDLMIKKIGNQVWITGK